MIAAGDWVLANKDAYDIRVANFSLHASSRASVFFDPLDQAVERLWTAGAVVVAVKGALVDTARALPAARSGSVGAGELDIAAARCDPNPSNPDAAVATSRTRSGSTTRRRTPRPRPEEAPLNA